MAELSYTSGPSTTPLLGQTIPANLKVVSAANSTATALVDRHSDRRWTYAEFDRDPTP
ncbi:hypothetical protein QFE97_19165 (plasmid) [Bacillus subtilis]|nr:hypothetical protein QFE97_19165 [Bacillus subtilis]